MDPLKLVSTYEQALGNIRRYPVEARKSARFRSRFATVRVWYAARNEAGAWVFGHSKFVGYQKLSASEYLTLSGKGGEAHGRETEKVLDQWFKPLDLDTALGRELVRELNSFVSQLSGRLRKSFKIKVEQAEFDRQRVHGGRWPTGYEDRITSNPNVCSGRPCIRGTRMRVADIVELVASGVSFDEILDDFPYLTREDIAAALAYAARAVGHPVIRAA